MSLDELNNAIDVVILQPDPKIIEITFSDYMNLLGQLTDVRLTNCDKIIFKFIS